MKNNLHRERQAGVFSRFYSLMLDSLFAAPFLYYPLKLLEETFPLNFFTIFYWPLVAILYYGLIPYFWSGYTPGKRIIGIRIEKDDGSKLTLRNMILRVLIGFSIYFITLGIALLISVIISFIKKDSRLLHDKLGQTIVLYTNPTDVKANVPIFISINCIPGIYDFPSN